MNGQPRLAPGEFGEWTRHLASSRNAGRCERCNKRPAAEHHHRRPRRMGGAGRIDDETTAGAANALCLCHECHDMTERRDRRRAIGDGVILKARQTPDEVPVRAYMGGRWGFWVLDDTGGYRPAEYTAPPSIRRDREEPTT